MSSWLVWVGHKENYFCIHFYNDSFPITMYDETDDGVNIYKLVFAWTSVAFLIIQITLVCCDQK